MTHVTTNWTCDIFCDTVGQSIAEMCLMKVWCLFVAQSHGLTYTCVFSTDWQWTNPMGQSDMMTNFISSTVQTYDNIMKDAGRSTVELWNMTVPVVLVVLLANSVENIWRILCNHVLKTFAQYLKVKTDFGYNEQSCWCRWLKNNWSIDRHICNIITNKLPGPVRFVVS